MDTTVPPESIQFPIPCTPCTPRLEGQTSRDSKVITAAIRRPVRRDCARPADHVASLPAAVVARGAATDSYHGRS